eukprot:TRINITY_DN74741_c0_g2_i2.p1 TRINITY_DN74741_c0_g2~~TRINITY_DN74741_c0_g2_i2.p1  ORF type:complete len:143 (-),score=9.81 TRINITY_DN74741_c0_g2_i2:134-562(-)
MSVLFYLPVKVNMQVAFSAVRGENHTVTQTQTIVCDVVHTNVGDCYNSRTGIFTAPVPGTYCFMATSGPNNVGINQMTYLRIVLGDDTFGTVFARGTGRDTGHCTAHMQAGQTVRLISCHILCAEVSFTVIFFTGMLLKPDL